MLRLSPLSLTLFIAAASAHLKGHRRHLSGRSPCRAPTLSEETKDRMAQLIGSYGHRIVTNDDGTTTRRLSNAACIQCIEVDMYFHIFHPVGSVSEMSAAVVQKQDEVLNQNFNATPFKFTLKDTRYIPNNLYYNFLDGHAGRIGNTYRRGGYDTLNVYFGAKTETGSSAYFPELVIQDGPDAGDFPAYDGAYIDISTVPGGTGNGGLGKTLTHEAGHWLGLHHTFEGDSCSGKGDYVDDTPQQATNTPYGTCPEGLDTCPDIPGLDPIHNYMDYSDDACYEEFSEGQIQRMFISFSIFRRQEEVCSDGAKLLRFEITADEDFGEGNDWTLQSDDGKFVVSQTGENYEIDYDYVEEGATIEHDICLQPCTGYRFNITDESAKNRLSNDTGVFTIFLEGLQIHDGSMFDDVHYVVNFMTSGCPPPSPALVTPVRDCSPSDQCGECSGHCRSDADCGEGLICFYKDRGEPGVDSVPGCSGTDLSLTDWCIVGDRETSTYPIPLIEPVKACSKEAPCNQCEGHCSNDNECAEGLYCFLKDEGTVGVDSVPGCIGTDLSKTNWCALGTRSDSDPAPLIEPVRLCTIEEPCARCEGHCRNDKVCAGDLYCFLKDEGTAGVDSVPGCIGADLSRTDWCTVGPRSDTDPAPLVKPVKQCTAEEPCVRCEGHCLNDDVCEGDLVCYKKDEGLPGVDAVPGCIGEDLSKTDWCTTVAALLLAAEPAS